MLMDAVVSFKSVCLCMCVCVYVCIYGYIYVCVYMCVYLYVYMCVYMCACVYMCVYVCLCVYMCVCVCVCLWVYMCVCVYTYLTNMRQISLEPRSGWALGKCLWNGRTTEHATAAQLKAQEYFTALYGAYAIGGADDILRGLLLRFCSLVITSHSSEWQVGSQ